MPYKNTVEVDDLVFKNFEKMMKGKKKSEDVFDQAWNPPESQLTNPTVESWQAQPTFVVFDAWTLR